MHFKFTLNKKSHEWDKKTITGFELREIGTIDKHSSLFYSVEGRDELVTDEREILLAHDGVEVFYSVKNPEFKFTINGKEFESEKKCISETEIRKLGHIDSCQAIFLKTHHGDELIKIHQEVDIAPFGTEHFLSKAIVKVKDKGKEVIIYLSAGEHSVTEIKKLANVSDDYVLSQVVDGQFIKLENHALVHIKGCEQFVSSVPSGGSSSIIPHEQLEDLKQLGLTVSVASEGGYAYVLVEKLKMPDGCNPNEVDALICNSMRDNYHSSLFLSSHIQGCPPLNWNRQNVRILDRNWFAISWQTQPNLSLTDILVNHLKPFQK